MKNISEQNRNLIIISLIFIIIIFTALLFQNKKVDNKYVKCEELTNNDSLIYTKRSCNIRDDYKKEYQLNMPFINIKSKNIKELNKKLETDFTKNLDITSYKFNKNKKEFKTVSLFSYKTYLSSEFLSIVIDNSSLYFNSSPVTNKRFYNISLTKKKLIKSNEISKLFNVKISNDDILNILIKMYLEEYNYNYLILDPMYKDPVVYNYIYYFDYNKPRDIIINDRGNLVYILEIREPNTGYKRYCYLEVVNNKLSYSFEM